MTLDRYGRLDEKIRGSRTHPVAVAIGRPVDQEPSFGHGRPPETAIDESDADAESLLGVVAGRHGGDNVQTGLVEFALTVPGDHNPREAANRTDGPEYRADPPEGTTPLVGRIRGRAHPEAGHPDVATLRSWRDRRVAPGARGRGAMSALMTVYERVGPRLAGHVRGRPRIARLLRVGFFAPLAGVLRRRAR